jgi:hypothetical protein
VNCANYPLKTRLHSMLCTVCFISIITILSMYLEKYNFTTCLHCLNLYMCPTIMCAILYIYYWLQYDIKKENICSSIKTVVISLIFVFDCSINSDCYGSFSHRHLHHISFYFYQRGTGPNNRIAELLALFVIKESALYFEGLLLI